ncbi:uncharacterized protein TNCV_3988801 [Trichonephila clavipes]|nr:uncharacterized protein TNCV_3988801 [Trichonephila clavipes]
MRKHILNNWYMLRYEEQQVLKDLTLLRKIPIQTSSILRESTSLGDIKSELKRLSENKLKTITDIFTNFISTKKGISICSLNYQSLRAHALDLDDSVMQHVTILLLIETWINNEVNIDDPNFHCIAKFPRHNHRAVGVAINKNKEGTTTYVTSKMDVASNDTESFGFY